MSSEVNERSWMSPAKKILLYFHTKRWASLELKRALSHDIPDFALRSF